MGSEENKPPESKEPTLAEVQEIALNASKVAAEAKDKAEAKEKVEQSLKDDVKEKNVNLSDEDCKKIAEATIAGLEARGAFEEVETTPSPPTPAQSEQPSQQPPNAPTEPPAPSSPSDDTQPKKRTFAERFVGRK